MKFSTILAAALASVAIAAPSAPESFDGLKDLSQVLKLQGLEGIVDNLKLGNIADELKLNELPLLSKVGDIKQSDKTSLNGAKSNGKIVQNLGPHLDNILTVVGPDVGTLLIELSPEVTALLSGLGLAGLGVPLGTVVASASSLGGLVTGLGPKVDGLVTVVGAEVGALLISLSPTVAGLLSGVGSLLALPTLGVPVGEVVATLGSNLKRGEILSDVAPEVKGTLITTGDNAKNLLLQLSPEITQLVATLGLTGAAVPLGHVIADAADVGDLVKDVSGPVEELLVITNDDGKNLLVKLSPDLASAVAGLGLPTLAPPLASIVTTVGHNL